jgi:tRNA nucleotidyltransferase (CCA-adding enzyme)
MSLALASAIARAVRDTGGRALIVGGWVRDRLRDRPSKDIDLEVFGVSQNQLAVLLQRFGRVEAVGQSFPVYKVIAREGGRGKGEAEGALDVALPRRESKSGRGHKGFHIVGDPFMTME